MAEQTLDEEHAEIKKRAVRRIIVAGTLVAAAVVTLTVLNHKPEEHPAPAAAPNAPAITAPEPAPPAPEPEKPAEEQAAEPPAPEVPVVPDSEAAPAMPPPPPPQVVNKTSHTPLVTTPPLANRDMAPQTKPIVPQAVTISPAPVPKKAVEPATLASKPIAAPPVKAPEPVSSKGYVVQLGLFSNYENAIQLQKRLAEHGIQSYTETRLHVGPFQDKAEADQAMAKIRSMGINAVLAPAH